MIAGLQKEVAGETKPGVSNVSRAKQFWGQRRESELGKGNILEVYWPSFVRLEDGDL